MVLAVFSYWRSPILASVKTLHTRYRQLCIATLAALAAIALWALSAGQFAISLREVFALMFGDQTAVSTNAGVVLFDIRLPRMAAAFMVGARRHSYQPREVRLEG